MAEQSAALRPGVAVSERDVLLATKLHVPRPQPGFVPRPRLAGRLDEGLARLVLVCAPAGFGKTAVLAGWARSGNNRVAWLSLDAGDNDPVRFWRHEVAALDRAHPGIGERAGPLLGPPAPSSFDGLVTAVINELAAEPGEDEVLLVLDDYHLIDSQPVHASLMFLLEHLPPGLRVVLASRSDPPLPLARLRASGQLAELRADELRFTADEAASLLREAAGADLPGAAVAALAARTEGWAAGLQLAALSLRGQADPAGFVAAFSGSHRYVLDYLAGEVLDRQPEEVRTFLLETSVLERLAAPHPAAARTARPGARAAPDRGRLVRRAWLGRRRRAARPGRRGRCLGGAADRAARRRAHSPQRESNPAAVACGAPGRNGPLTAAAVPSAGIPRARGQRRGRGRAAAGCCRARIRGCCRGAVRAVGR